MLGIGIPKPGGGIMPLGGGPIRGGIYLCGGTGKPGGTMPGGSIPMGGAILLIGISCSMGVVLLTLIGNSYSCSLVTSMT